MTLFRKKPITIEAELFTGDNALAVADWINNHGGQASGYINQGIVHIETLEGRMTATAGDWIIRGVQSEFYPCKPDIFAATYEPVVSL